MDSGPPATARIKESTSQSTDRQRTLHTGIKKDGEIN
jgi:hypothetical protein